MDEKLVETRTIFGSLQPHAEEVVADRQRWLSVLAKSTPESLKDLVADLSLPVTETLRPAETGMVMVRGRAGGAGNPFNLGEMTVTRCVVRLASGETGVGYVAGRDKRHAELAAAIDALLQSPAHRQRVHAAVIEPLERAARDRRDLEARKAAATRVEFFTMVRDRKA